MFILSPLFSKEDLKLKDLIALEKKMFTNYCYNKYFPGIFSNEFKFVPKTSTWIADEHRIKRKQGLFLAGKVTNLITILSLVL